LDDLIEHEEEPALGNGGLGRLAACFLDSLATLEVPWLSATASATTSASSAKRSDNGWQVEDDRQLAAFRPSVGDRAPRASCMKVKFGGHTESYAKTGGDPRALVFPTRWLGIAYDIPIPGYGNTPSTLLRLWKRGGLGVLRLRDFNAGDYIGAVTTRCPRENITKVLYPERRTSSGQGAAPEAAVLLRLLLAAGHAAAPSSDHPRGWTRFHEKFGVQLNDTHPAIAVAELMRLLIDEHCCRWDVAWDITRKTFGYTNHTLLPEALERWPVEPLFTRAAAPPGDHLPHQPRASWRRWAAASPATWSCCSACPDRRRRRAQARAHGQPGLRRQRSRSMAWPSCTPSCSSHACCRLPRLWPEKFNNKTNGVTPRRWLLLANPGWPG
jgi:starch phosphorylase